MSDKNLDNLFKSKLGERSFEYNPKAWQAMEQMLDDRKPSLAFYWGTAATVLAFFGLSLIFALTQTSAVSNNEVLNPVVVSPNTEELNLSNHQKPLKKEQNNVADNIERLKEPSTQENTSRTTNAEESSTIANQASQPSFKTTPKAAIDNNTNETVAQKETENVTLKTKNLLTLPELEYSSIIIDSEAALRKPTRKPFALTPATKWVYPFVRVGGLSSSVNFNATNGYGFSAGVGLDKPLSPNWLVSTSINYVQRTKPGLQKTADSLKYSFTESRIKYQEEIVLTQHLEIPVSINYQIANRHRLGAGVSFSYLLNADAYRERNEKSFKSQRVDYDLGSPKLYYLAKYNWSTHLQYQFLIAKKISLGTSIHYSFTDFTLETTEKQHLTDVRLFLQYAF